MALPVVGFIFLPEEVNILNNSVLYRRYLSNAPRTKIRNEYAVFWNVAMIVTNIESVITFLH
jgi:hypothetical protein